ncbi:DNA primase [Candidatus Woesearchaeota archaeon]|jgi:DNA primase|nr:DNA primase [Candidatus Woesearchaeota archaeon]MBT6044516.1 DNA primase [Candidatus Woesearchaeota archaeon]
MGKISLVSAKYIVHASIAVEGMVDRPDVIGSVFGQTEGLLGSDLELRELQSSGRIGRIEVELSSKDGKTSGTISIPSSLDKTETALIAAAIETIERIGPCNAKVKVTMLEDVRAAKRGVVIDRAKALLSNLTHGTLPDSKDIKEKVSTAVRVADIVSYGKDKLPAGPEVKDSESVILVEGRADVINLLRYDIKNAVAMNGTSVPETVISLSKVKEVIVFLDGDRGGDLILRELKAVAEIEFVARAPDGKEVEEITHKEIHQALRNKIKFETAIDNLGTPNQKFSERSRRTDTRARPQTRERTSRFSRDRKEFKPRERREFKPRERRDFQPRERSFDRPLRIPVAQREKFTKLMDELKGSKEAYLLDGKSNVLGKVPTKEIGSTIKDIGRSANTILIDGSLTKDILESAEVARIKYLIGTKSYLKDVRSRVKVLTRKDLQQ